MRSGPGPPIHDVEPVYPSVELIDLTGLSSDDENDNKSDNKGDDTGEWEEVHTIIDLTNLPSDDEEQDAVKIFSADHIPTVPAEHRQQQPAKPNLADTCELCGREARYDRGITRHHLYPQSVVKAAPTDAYTPEQKNSVALLCWPCHSAIHRMMTNTRLATSFHSVELLKTSAEVQSWIRRMQRATTAELDLPRRGPRALHVASRTSKRKTRFLRRSDAARPLPSQRPDEDLSRYSALRRSARLAQLGTGGAPGYISDFGLYKANRACGVNKSRMTKRQRKAARSIEKAAMFSQISQALNTIWEQNGNAFPKLVSEKTGKSGGLRDEVQYLVGRKVEVHEVRYVLRSIPEFRAWYDWAFAIEMWPMGKKSVGEIQSKSVDGRVAHEYGATQAIGGYSNARFQEDDGGIQIMEGIQTLVEEADRVIQATEGNLTHVLPQGDGGNPTLEGTHIHHRGGFDISEAPGLETQERIKALEEAGEYIPL